MTLVSEARKRRVMSTSQAETVGKVDGFVVDAPARAIVAVKLKKTPVKGDYVDWRDLRFGPDAVTIESVDVIGEPRDQAADVLSGHHEVLGHRVLTDVGEELGKVDDLDFDPDTGTVRYLVCGKQEINGDRLLAAGDYAVIVHHT